MGFHYEVFDSVLPSAHLVGGSKVPEADEDGRQNLLELQGNLQRPRRKAAQRRRPQV